MAEEVIAEPNFEKLCSNIIDSDNQIRFAAFVNDKSKILHSAQRDNLDDLLADLTELMANRKKLPVPKPGQVQNH